jgi:elongation factor P
MVCVSIILSVQYPLMPSIKAGNIRKGTHIRFKNQPYLVTKADFTSPGKGSAFMRCRLKSLQTTSTVEFTFKSNETVEELDISSVKMQYLYHDADEVVFMNQRNYEQASVPIGLLEDQLQLLLPEMEAYVLLFEEKPIGVSLPTKITMTVVRADDAVAGDTVGQAKKEAEVETGLLVQVPLFIKKGEKIIVDTATKQYVSRA